MTVALGGHFRQHAALPLCARVLADPAGGHYVHKDYREGFGIGIPVMRMPAAGTL